MTASSELAQLWSVARRYYRSRSAIATTIALAIVVGVADVICPWLLGDAIDALVALHQAGSGSVARPVVDVVVIGGVIAAQFVAHYAMVRAINGLIYGGTTALRLDLARSIDASVMDEAGRMRLGDVLSRWMADVQQLQDCLLDLLAELPFDVVTIVGLAIAMLLMAPRLGVIVLAFLLLMVAASMRLGRRGWAEQVAVQEQAGAVGARLAEGAAAAKTISAMGATRQERNALAHDAAELERFLVSSGRTRALVAPFFGLSEYVGLLMVLGVGGWFLLRGELSVGGLVCMLAYMEMAAEPISRCGRILPRLQKAAASAVRIRALSERPVSEFGDHELPDAIGRVSLEEVTFTYPGARRPALNRITTVVQPGEILAIVGRNGAGKSTLLDLMLRLQVPSAGRILIDGVDLTRLSLAAHSRIIGVVQQDVILLNRSITDNIALGLENTSTVAGAVAATGLEEIIRALPQGLDTQIGERGATLSGGQRQRIAIARLFARDSRVVILDEPTSALDALSEAAVLPALRRLCEGRTTLMVSHRKPLLELADRVLLLEQGEPVADAAPSEVWERFPHWRDLFPPAWSRQTSIPATSHAGSTS